MSHVNNWPARLTAMSLLLWPGCWRGGQKPCEALPPIVVSPSLPACPHPGPRPFPTLPSTGDVVEVLRAAGLTLTDEQAWASRAETYVRCVEASRPPELPQ
jgi:hypothetical protein